MQLSFFAMASYHILTLVLDWSIWVYLQPMSVIHSGNGKLCPISSPFASFILEVICCLSEEIFRFCSWASIFLT